MHQSQSRKIRNKTNSEQNKFGTKQTSQSIFRYSNEPIENLKYHVDDNEKDINDYAFNENTRRASIESADKEKRAGRNVY